MCCTGFFGLLLGELLGLVSGFILTSWSFWWSRGREGVRMVGQKLQFHVVEGLHKPQRRSSCGM